MFHVVSHILKPSCKKLQSNTEQITIKAYATERYLLMLMVLCNSNLFMFDTYQTNQMDWKLMFFIMLFMNAQHIRWHLYAICSISGSRIMWQICTKIQIQGFCIIIDFWTTLKLTQNSKPAYCIQCITILSTFYRTFFLF